MKLSGNTVHITGGSSGIGLAFVGGWTADHHAGEVCEGCAPSAGEGPVGGPGRGAQLLYVLNRLAS